jgi:hypothetical protein
MCINSLSFVDIRVRACSCICRVYLKSFNEEMYDQMDCTLPLTHSLLPALLHRSRKAKGRGFKVVGARELPIQHVKHVSMVDSQRLDALRSIGQVHHVLRAHDGGGCTCLRIHLPFGFRSAATAVLELGRQVMPHTLSCCTGTHKSREHLYRC